MGLAEGLALVLQPEVLTLWIVGMLFGIFIGSMPGLTATMAAAILVPLTYYMSPLAGLAVIIGCVDTAIFAGDIPATYMRIPGTPASGAAILDGYEMTKKGKPSLALKLDLLCSALGGVVGFTILIFGATALAAIALHFHWMEIFWLIFFGLATSIVVSRGTLAKGAIALAVGLLVSTIGIDIVSGYARFTFGSTELLAGVSFIPAMIGLFGIPVILRTLSKPEEIRMPSVMEREKYSLASAGSELKKHKSLFFRSSLTGTLIGFLPGAGADMGAWVSYGVAKRSSKHPEKYGTGCVEGVIAPTSANNAALGGTWIPALALGIPGDSITALVLGAAMIYGLRPGPMVFDGFSGSLVYGMFILALLTQVLEIPIGYLGIISFAKIYKLPRNIIMPIILLFCIVGSYALRFSMFDVGIMLSFGLMGCLMEMNKIPLVPVVLGIILGPMLERHLRTGLMKTGGSIVPFFTRPIAFIIFTVILLFVFWPKISALISRVRERRRIVKR